MSNWHREVNIVKIGKGCYFLKRFNRNIKISENKNVPQYVNFSCGLTHIYSSLKKISTIYRLQKVFSKKEMDLDEVFEGTWIS